MSLELRLVLQVDNGDLRGVHEALAAGACVDGSPDLPTPPLVLAAELGDTDVLQMLIGRGADLEVTVLHEDINEYGVVIVPLGSRALHAAVIGEEVSCVRCLLKAGANPDVLNSEGFTPLMLAYELPEIVAELLKGGANPTFANKDGAIALHGHALNRAHDEAMRLLIEAAPSTVNQRTKSGFTPLVYAAQEGNEASVALLLSAGARDKDVHVHEGTSSLWMAMEEGNEKIVRMIVDAGMDVIGGSMALLGAFCRASERRQARTLDMLLGVEGEARKKYWARQLAGNLPVLHHAAMYGSPATVQVCLAAGADETFVNPTGIRAADIAGLKAPSNPKNPDMQAKAIRRLLRRGPACRAQSWAWPPLKAAGVGSGGGGKPTPPAAGVNVRVFRSRNNRLLATRFARYAQK